MEHQTKINIIIFYTYFILTKLFLIDNLTTITFKPTKLKLYEELLL